MLLKECPRCFTIVKGEFNFCIYCGLKLRIRSNSKEMEKTIVKKLTSKQNLKTQGLSFCNECGALMFPDKVNYKLVMKCKCGFTKPFDENKANSYKISSNIKHLCTEESIYRCVCSKKFQSHVEFLEHTRNCKKIVVRDIIHLLENKGTFFHVNNIDPLKKKGTFLESFRSAIFKFPETSINSQEKMAKKMGISNFILSKEMKLVIDQSYSGHVISKLSNMPGYGRLRNRSYIRGMQPSNLLLVMISIIGPILQHLYALGYDREKIFNRLKFFKNKQRVEDWTQYIFKMTSVQALIYFKEFSNYYDFWWWHQNFATSKDFLAI